MDESTEFDAPAEGFRVVRRGYDRQQVDARLSAATRRIGSLEHRIRELEAGLSELGLDRPTDLAGELDLVGEDVKRILAEARVAAEKMRSRAAEDAARWRAEADTESREVRKSARSVAYAVRQSVWENGTEMLAATVAEGEALMRAATERALFVQAEAERERRAKIIAAEGEFQAAAQLTEAAEMMGHSPGAMTLRYLQTLNSIGVEQNTTTIFPVPLELFAAFMKTNATNEEDA